jgi:WD40 repeat protein
MRRLALLVCLLPLSAAVAEAPVSFFRDVAPVLKRNCHSCHRPGKAKGGLDLSTFAAVMRGGGEGTVLIAGKPHESLLIESVSGEEPEMPKDGEPLSAEERGTIERWIAQGAKNDTPADAGSRRPSAPPVYRALPAVTALAWSPDGALLAVAGYHEVILRSGDGAQVIARLVGESPRIESLAFSADGKLLAAAGGAPSESGEIQLWDVAERRLVRSIKTTADTVYGVSLSPDATRVAVGCADGDRRGSDALRQPH